jgi:tetratricopeptide (TPR) repeat protein
MKISPRRTPKSQPSKIRANRGVRVKTDRTATLDFAEMAMAGGNPRQALNLVGRLLAGDPDHLPGLELRARALWQLGELDELYSTIGSMIRLNPYEPGYFALLGAVEQSRGQIGAAIRSLNRCQRLSQKPDRATGEMLRELHVYQKAVLETLLAEDARFRAEYRRNPVQAARSRGFEIAAPATEPLGPVSARPSLLFARPS